MVITRSKSSNDPNELQTPKLITWNAQIEKPNEPSFTDYYFQKFSWLTKLKHRFHTSDKQPVNQCKCIWKWTNEHQIKLKTNDIWKIGKGNLPGSGGRGMWVLGGDAMSDFWKIPSGFQRNLNTQTSYASGSFVYSSVQFLYKIISGQRLRDAVFISLLWVRYNYIIRQYYI